MSKTNSNHTSGGGGGGGGFLGCLCRPKHLEDTGVYLSSTYMNGTTSRSIPTSSHGGTNSNDERPRVSTTTTTTSSIQPSHSQRFGSNTGTGTGSNTGTGTGSKANQPHNNRTNKDYIRQSHIGVMMNREIPLIPSPPSDDATPLMSNRKVGGTTTSTSSNSGMNNTTTTTTTTTLPPQPPPPNSKPKKSTLKITEGTKIVLVKNETPPSATSKLLLPPPVVDTTTCTSTISTEHPEDEMEEYYGNKKNNNSSQTSRKSVVSYYPNHVQDNVKVMRDYYEQQAFISNTPSGSRSSYEDMTESTMEDITESSSAMDDLLATTTTTTNNHNPSLLLRIDCQDDPYESAYALWYRKGLLKWRPKSVPHSEMSSAVSAFVFPDTSSSMENNDINVKDNTAVSSSSSSTSNGIAPKNSADLDVVEASTPSIVPPPKMHTNNITSADPNDVDDDMIQTRSLLEKYRSSSSTSKACSNCQKDLKHTIPIVKCTLCQQELYCSIFCRGNDRYTHSTTCPAQPPPQQQESVSSSDPTGMISTSTTMITTPKSLQRRSDSNHHNNSPVVILDENSTSRSNSYKKSRQVPMVSLFGHQNSNSSTSMSNTTNNLDSTTLSARRLTTEFRV